MPWTDYPQAATDNAKRALKLREEEGTDCGTPVGWESARIIANREAVTAQRLPRVFIAFYLELRPTTKAALKMRTVSRFAVV